MKGQQMQSCDLMLSSEQCSCRYRPRTHAATIANRQHSVFDTTTTSHKRSIVGMHIIEIQPYENTLHSFRAHGEALVIRTSRKGALHVFHRRPAKAVELLRTRLHRAQRTHRREPHGQRRLPPSSQNSGGGRNAASQHSWFRLEESCGLSPRPRPSVPFRKSLWAPPSPHFTSLVPRPAQHRHSEP